MEPNRKKAESAAGEFPYQDPHEGPRSGRLEEAIGPEVRRFREKITITIRETSKACQMSAVMNSNIENGPTSPSLSSLQSMSRALQVPVTALFRSFEEVRDAAFVRAGEGLK